MTDWLAIGDPVTNAGAFNPSTTIDPTTIGNILVMWGGLATDGETEAPTPTGGGVDEWNLFPNDAIASGGGTIAAYIWFGVITATGSTDVGLDGGITYVGFIVQEFQPPDGIMAWDTNFGMDTSDDTGPLLSGNVESTSPNGNDRLYVATVSQFGGTDNPLTGDSPGFTYDVVHDGGMLGIYTYDAESADSYSPNWSQESVGNYCDIAGFIGVAPPSTMQNVMVV